MIYGTLCSGIGAPEVAMPDQEFSLQSEIEAFPRAVLQERHGAQDARYSRKAGPALWGDFTAIRVRFLKRLGIALPQWLIAGTPCQAFSLAGLRQSLADDRGNLTLEFVRLAHSLRRAGSLRGFTWENVPGVLSTKDNAFGCFLAAVVGADAPLRSPLERGRWPDAGMVAGPWARLAWRVFDAQYFGLAQRRRRVFVVASFGNGPDPAAILFERQGMHGNPAPRREAGEGIAGTLESRADGGGFPGTDGACSGHVVPAGGVAFGGNNTSGPIDVATAVNAHGGPHGRCDFESETFVTAALDASFGRLQGCSGQDMNHGHSHLLPVVTHSLRPEGCDASEDGTGRGTPLIPVAYQTSGNSGAWETGDITGALDTNTDPNSHVVAFSCKDYAQDATDDCSPTLRGMVEGDGNQNGGGQVAIATIPILEAGARTGVSTDDPRAGIGIGDETDPMFTLQAGKQHAVAAFDLAQITSAANRTRCEEGLPASTISSNSRMHLAAPSAVRRLTPVECERLQGFPDGFTAITYRGKAAADGPRYRALGNSMAVPCMRWICERIEAAAASNIESEAA